MPFLLITGKTVLEELVIQLCDFPRPSSVVTFWWVPSAVSEHRVFWSNFVATVLPVTGKSSLKEPTAKSPHLLPRQRESCSWSRWSLREEHPARLLYPGCWCQHAGWSIRAQGKKRWSVLSPQACGQSSSWRWGVFYFWVWVLSGWAVTSPSRYPHPASAHLPLHKDLAYCFMGKTEASFIMVCPSHYPSHSYVCPLSPSSLFSQGKG